MARVRKTARTPVVQVQETFPEADRLEGFLHPRMTPKLFGHVDGTNALINTFEGGRMHHAWLITGPNGIGKATLAYQFIKYALSDADHRRPPGDGAPFEVENNPAVGRVESLAHPGLLLIRRAFDVKTKKFSSQIRIDDVRRLRSFLTHKEDQGHWRFVLIDRADELNLSAANALLKSLEEPPEQTVFLLLSAEPGRLLKTIRSRCRQLHLSPLGQDDLMAAVREAVRLSDTPDAHDLSEIDRLVEHAEGNPRRLLSLLSQGGGELQQQVWHVFSSLPKLDWSRVHKLSDGLAPVSAADRFELFFTLFMDLLARIIRAKATGEASPPIHELASRLIKDEMLASWANMWETLAREKAEAARLNLDRKTLILTSFAQLENVAR